MDAALKVHMELLSWQQDALYYFNISKGNYIYIYTYDIFWALNTSTVEFFPNKMGLEFSQSVTICNIIL